MKLSPKLFKRLLNFYPPYLGAGVKINHISHDWRELRVSLSVRWYNRNAVGTHFGGSLYSMVDPHHMLLLMRLLGNEYWVWDKSAEIEYVKATRKKVSAMIKISDAELESIKLNTADGNKYFPEFSFEIKDEDDNLIARIKKVLYVRKKQPKS